MSGRVGPVNVSVNVQELTDKGPRRTPAFRHRFDAGVAGADFAAMEACFNAFAAERDLFGVREAVLDGCTDALAACGDEEREELMRSILCEHFLTEGREVTSSLGYKLGQSSMVSLELSSAPFLTGGFRCKSGILSALV